MSDMFNRQRITQASYLADESKMTGRADNVILPYDESELRDAMRYANSKGLRLTVSGLRTGLCGGSVPQGGDVLSLEHMSGMIGRGKDRKGYFVRVQPCRSAAVSATARDACCIWGKRTCRWRPYAA